jgi:predicted RNA-binding protein with PIN domain
MIDRISPQYDGAVFRFRDGVRETVLVLVAIVGFGLAWADPSPSRDAAVPPPYPVRAMTDPTADESARAPSTWLVDGYNVLHAGILGGRDRQEWWTEPRRRELLDRVSLFDDPCTDLWVVFDGPRAPDDPAAESDARLHAVFADSADAWMLARVRAAEDPASIAVVTADRAVASRARHRGAHVVSPRLFLARCSPETGPDRAL